MADLSVSKLGTEAMPGSTSTAPVKKADNDELS